MQLKRLLAALLAGLAMLVGAMPLAASAQAPAEPDAEPPQVSVLTFAPGEDYWQRFGHDALLLRHADGRAVTYNYGIFDFRQKNFFLNFARGHMQYRVVDNWLANDLRYYEGEGRWVREQRLALTPAQRAAMKIYLETNVLPQNAEYGYDYFVSNCATRVRDAIDAVLGGTLKPQLQAMPAQSTYRFEATRLISPDFGLMLAMDYALGPTADRPIERWQQSFVPAKLMEALRAAKTTGEDGQPRPLVAEETELRPPVIADAPAAPPELRTSFAVAGLAFAALLWLLSRGSGAAARIGFSLLAGSHALVCGVMGVLLSILWLFTAHWAGWHNQNLLLTQPLYLWTVPGWFAAMSPRWRPGPWLRRVMALIVLGGVFALLLHALPQTRQANLPWIALLLPAQFVLGYVCWRGTWPGRPRMRT